MPPTAAVNFEVDVVAILGAIFNHAEGRNDLGIIIQNGLNTELTVRFDTPLHGAVAGYQGSSTIAPIGGGSQANLYACGFDARGAGVDIKVYVGGPTWSWGFYFKTRPDRDNIFQVIHTHTKLTPQAMFGSVATLDDVKNDTRFYNANQGEIVQGFLDGIDVHVRMTNEGGKPASALISFEPGPRRSNCSVHDAINKALGSLFGRK
jgi:hypothetical protein